jgi:hypothetical protein
LRLSSTSSPPTSAAPSKPPRRRCGAPSALAPAPAGAEVAETAFLECLEDIWEMDGEAAFIEFAFDPADQQRTNVTLNSATASLAGMHKEEVPPTPT